MAVSKRAPFGFRQLPQILQLVSCSVFLFARALFSSIIRASSWGIFFSSSGKALRDVVVIGPELVLNPGIQEA